MAEQYSEKKYLQSYQCDRYGNMRPLILMNELQGAGDKHIESLGVGYRYCGAHGVAWVVTHYLVDILEMPTAREEIELFTWSYFADDLRAVREFEIRGTDGRLLVRATSQWVLLNMESRRPMRLSEYMPEFSHVVRRAWDKTFDKFSDFIPTKTHVMKCRFDDIDVNQHINNAVYAVWATESVGYEFRDAHKLRSIELNFKKEINPNTPSVDIDVAFDGNVTHHKIRTGDTVHAYVDCVWEPRK